MQLIKQFISSVKLCSWSAKPNWQSKAKYKIFMKKMLLSPPTTPKNNLMWANHLSFCFLIMPCGSSAMLFCSSVSIWLHLIAAFIKNKKIIKNFFLMCYGLKLIENHNVVSWSVSQSQFSLLGSSRGVGGSLCGVYVLLVLTLSIIGVW